MNKLILTAALIAAIPGAALIAAVPAAAQPPKGFEARIETLRETIGVPGMSIAIVEKGRTVLARGWGVRKLGGTDKVDGDTIFPTGSTGKAFTAAALATLVDADKLSWDDKVAEKLPGFQMYDPWVTREMTVRDLLTHRSGLALGAGDLMFVPRGSLSRAEVTRRVRFLKPATSFRSGYAYDNILYAVAGQLVEAVSGQTWEDYVREHVLRRAGMTRSTSDSEERFLTANRAFPHARPSATLRGLGLQQMLDERDELGRNAAPAGGLAISANDMAKWLTLQLARGKLPDGTRLFSEAQALEMWKPVVLTPIAPRPAALKLTEPMFDTYALGWSVRDYRGVRLVMHTGGVLGFQSVVVLIPDRDIGFSVETNCEDSQIIFGVLFELLDHYLGFPANDWPAKFAADKAQRLAAGAKKLAEAKASPAKAGPSLPLARYAGSYADPWYGNINVAIQDGGLTIDFTSTPRMKGRLEHWQYDTFVTRIDDKNVEPAYVTFALDAQGGIDRVTMKAVSPTADFSYDYHDLLFTPVKK